MFQISGHSALKGKYGAHCVKKRGGEDTELKQYISGRVKYNNCCKTMGGGQCPVLPFFNAFLHLRQSRAGVAEPFRFLTQG